MTPRSAIDVRIAAVTVVLCVSMTSASASGDQRAVRHVGHLKLRSSPAGASVAIDGEPLGVTPLDWDLSPGKHTIHMELDRAAQDREVLVRANATDVVAMSFEPAGETGRDDSLLIRMLPAAAMGAGAAAVVTGGLLIAIDHDGGPQAPLHVRNSASAGLVFTVTGIALIGAGTYRWFRRKQWKASPVAAMTRDVAYIGWARQF